MKESLEDILDLLGIEGFKTQINKSSKDGMFREYFSSKAGNKTFLLMSNEFTRDKEGKFVGRPNPEEDIWCVMLDKRDNKYDYVIQYSNKGTSSVAEGSTYGKAGQ